MATTIEHNGQKVATIPQGKETFTIGRGEENDLTIVDVSRNASRSHCTITLEGDRVFIIDNDSSNGTFHNGTKIVSRVTLEDGNKIGLGENLKLTVRITD